MGRRAVFFLLVIVVVGVAVSCKTDPRFNEDASTELAPRADAGGVDGGDAAVEAVEAAAAIEPIPPAPVVRSGRDLEEMPPPPAKSAVPTSWADGVELVVHGHHDCDAVLKREWVKMTCPSAASVALLAGSVDGVMLDVREPPADPHAADFFGQPPRKLTGVAIFPVRRGDRRLIQFNVFHQGVQSGYESSPDSVTSGPLLSEVWLDGDKGPRLEAD